MVWGCGEGYLGPQVPSIGGSPYASSDIRRSLGGPGALQVGVQSFVAVFCGCGSGFRVVLTT